MKQVVWTPEARLDVVHLHGFLAENDTRAADRALNSITLAVSSLATHPQLGRTFSDDDPEYREILIPFGRSGYMAVYRFDGNKIVILAVRHQSKVGYTDNNGDQS